MVDFMPDYIVFEASTPVIERYWEIINGIKEQDILKDIKIILCGDHVTALPKESREKCKADYIVEGGQWHKKVFKIVTQSEWEGGLPLMERNGTQWWLYAYRNGNFKYVPGTYIQSAFDCWYGKCTFCSWAQYYKDCELREVEDVLTEVEYLVQMGFKEIFDDSGTFPSGEWLREFCTKVKERGYSEHASFGCNMRFGALREGDYKLLADAGFRMILWGLESVNQDTLDILNKGYKVPAIEHDLKLAKEAGLQSHVTVMFGFPWEQYKDARRTYDKVREYLLNGLAWSAQATVCIPYPGTPLWQICKDKNLLTTEVYSEYDMTKAIMKVPYSEKKLFALKQGIYNISYHPKFIWNKLKQVKCMDDLRYYFRIAAKIYDRDLNWYQIHKGQ